MKRTEVDAEIRQRYATLPKQQRDALNAQMRDGRNDDVELPALVRDPFALPPTKEG